jgi:DNA polymerase gamma 1
LQQLKIKAAPKRSAKKSLLAEPEPKIEEPVVRDEENKEFLELESKFKHLFELKKLMPARRPLLPGYPTWYRKLCTKVSAVDPKENEEWQSGPHLISTGMQVTPKLLSLCWEGE